MSEKEHHIRPNLEELRDRALENFRSKEAIIGPGGMVEGYGAFHAADEVVRGTGIPAEELFGILRRETTATPEQLNIATVDFDSWENFFHDLASSIIIYEMGQIDSSVMQETYDRVDYFSADPFNNFE